MKKRQSKAAILVAALIAMLFSCGSERRADLAILDPAFDELFPSAAGALRGAGYALAVLPSEGSSRALFEAIERAAPARLIVSPLLGQEIAAIAKSRPGLAIGAIAFEEQDISGAAVVLRFRGVDAARAGAEAALRELSGLEPRRPEAASAALFAGADAERRAEAFKSVFLDAKAAKLPIVEVASADWSSEAAARIRSLDNALVYLSVPEKELGRWLRELSEGEGPLRSAFIIAESPQVPLEPWHNCDAIVYWDLEGSIKRLAELLRAPQTEAIDAAGAWHYKKLR